MGRKRNINLPAPHLKHLWLDALLVKGAAYAPFVQVRPGRSAAGYLGISECGASFSE
jgi:hypothetical protein